MSKQKKLTFARGIFIFITTVLLGLLVMNEKKSTIILPKVKEKMNEYIQENYKDIINNINISDVSYENNDYIMKVISKNNQDYFFYVKYQDNKINDSYQEDYIEGKQLLQKIAKDLQNEINTETNENCKVEIITTLDKFTTQVKDRIIKEEDLKDLKFYSISFELQISNWDYKTITKEITNKMNNFKSKNIDPKYYKITITNKNDITQSIEISNITSDFITHQYKEYIISDILEGKQTQLLQQNKIKYTYLN